MKTIFRILACYLAVSLILPSVTGEENQHTIDEAEYALQEFMSQSGWNDYNGFWPVSFSTVKGEIDSNYPLALMFNSGILYGVRHSTTMVGYSVITYSGTPANYVIVRDPGTSGVPELYLSWNSTNIHGYYLIYVG